MLISPRFLLMRMNTHKIHIARKLIDKEKNGWKVFFSVLLNKKNVKEALEKSSIKKAPFIDDMICQFCPQKQSYME